MNLVFDFDGTICDSFGAAIDIIKKYFPEYWDEKMSIDKIRNIGLKGFIKKYKVPKYKLIKVVIVGRREIAKHIPNLNTFEGIESVIKQLSNNNKLAILTTNSKANVEKFLKRNNLEEYFNFIHSGTSVFGKDKKLRSAMRKYNLNPKETFYIGDETRDIEAAKKVRIKSVAVTWGFESEKVLKKADPDHIIKSPEEFLAIFN